MRDDKNDYGHLMQQLGDARSALMLPHTKGEEDSIVLAFGFCHRAFHLLDEENLDKDTARQWVSIIKGFMGRVDTSGKLTEMSDDDKLELSIAVSALANYCYEEYLERRT